MAKKKTNKFHSRLKKHPWDETMVIAVMITAVLCILILLASHMNVLGMAYSSLPREQGVLNMLSNGEMISGEGKTKCNINCGKIGETCVLAWEGEELKSCSDKIEGEYSCLCGSPERLVGKVPG